MPWCCLRAILVLSGNLRPCYLVLLSVTFYMVTQVRETYLQDAVSAIRTP